MSTCAVIATGWPRRKWSRSTYPDSFAVPCLFGGLEVLAYNVSMWDRKKRVLQPCGGECIHAGQCERRPNPHHRCSAAWTNPANLCASLPGRGTP